MVTQSLNQIYKIKKPPLYESEGNKINDMTNLNNQSQTSKQGFDIPAIAKEVERVYGIYNQNIVRTVLEQAAAPELLEALQLMVKDYWADYKDSEKPQFKKDHPDHFINKAEAAITKATGGTK